MTFTSAVVPVYNSATTLAELIDRLDAALAPLGEHEIVLVDDHSDDGSWERIRALAESRPSIRGIALTRNYGQHNAVLAGVRAARGDVIVTLDDDLQHPPEEIPTLLAALHEGYDVVYGTPRREQHGWWRDGASRTAKWTLRTLLGWRLAPEISDFRAFRADLRDGFAAAESPSVSFDAMLAWVTGSFCSTPVEHAPRQHGRSNYGPRSLIEYGVTMATGYSTFPLRLAAVAGAVLATVGAVALILALALPAWHAGGGIGEPFIAGAVAFLAGVQLLGIGVLGEYLGRLYFRAMGRPQYVIREKTEGHVASARQRPPESRAERVP
jgi:undecaprenyl-phosphate 4-deoxy-4-formamido-L-arabinose transferase